MCSVQLQTFLVESLKGTLRTLTFPHRVAFFLSFVFTAAFQGEPEVKGNVKGHPSSR